LESGEKQMTKIAVRLMLYFFLINVTGQVMAKNSELSASVNGSVSANAISVLTVKDTEFNLLMRGDTQDPDMPGIGFFTGHLASDEVDLMRELMSLPRTSQGTVPYFRAEKLMKRMYSGNTLEKLDVTCDIAPQNNKMLVTVRFKNSGTSAIQIPSPAGWEGRMNPAAQNSWILVTGVRTENIKDRAPDTEFNLGWFGGAELINKKEIDEGILTILPGQTRTAKYLLWPSNEFKEGRYLIGVTVSIREVFAPQTMKGGPVEFTSPEKYIDFVRAYPSTLEEKRAFSTHRESLR
jgi:hypothetical protein